MFSVLRNWSQLDREFVLRARWAVFPADAGIQSPVVLDEDATGPRRERILCRHEFTRVLRFFRRFVEPAGRERRIEFRHSPMIRASGSASCSFSTRAPRLFCHASRIASVTVRLAKSASMTRAGVAGCAPRRPVPPPARARRE